MNDYLEMHSAYLAHFKTKGAKNGIRRYQSYAVAPNPSGAEGQEIGEAAEQRARVMSKKEANAEAYKQKLASRYTKQYEAQAQAWSKKGLKIADKAMKNLNSNRSESKKREIDAKLTKKAGKALAKSILNKIMANNATAAIMNMSTKDALSEKRKDTAVKVLSGALGFSFGIVGGVPAAMAVGGIHGQRQAKRMEKRIQDYTRENTKRFEIEIKR